MEESGHDVDAKRPEPVVADNPDPRVMVEDCMPVSLKLELADVSLPVNPTKSNVTIAWLCNDLLKMAMNKTTNKYVGKRIENVFRLKITSELTKY